MRRPVMSGSILKRFQPLVELSHVVAELLTMVFVVIDYPEFARRHLEKPDHRGVAYAQVPRGMHRQQRIICDGGDVAVALKLGDLLAEIRPDDRRGEATLKFLGVLLWRHVGGGLRQLIRRQYAGLGGP